MPWFGSRSEGRWPSLDAPLTRDHVVLAPGQRLDVWANFGSGPGDDVWLESRGFDDLGSAMGMGGGEVRVASVLRSGLLDEGWQDTLLVLPGDRVRIRKRFEHYPGLFLYHCHLEHEDMGMMRNFLVEET